MRERTFPVSLLLNCFNLQSKCNLCLFLKVCSNCLKPLHTSQNILNVGSAKLKQITTLGWILPWEMGGWLLVDSRPIVSWLPTDSRPIVDRYIGQLSAYMWTEATYSSHDPGEVENKFSRKGGRVVTRNFSREGGLMRRHLLQHLYYLHFYSGFFIRICLNIC